jgi:hypothetical protein
MGVFDNYFQQMFEPHTKLNLTFFGCGGLSYHAYEDIYEKVQKHAISCCLLEFDLFHKKTSH